MGDIAPPRVRSLSFGSFQRYEESLARSGRTMVQYKPVQILHDEAARKYFAAEADKFEGMMET